MKRFLKITEACVIAVATLLIFSATPVLALQQARVTADDLVYLTENFPPHNFEKNNRITGASVEILEMIWQRMGCNKTDKDIEMIPWARGIKRLENEPNIVLFGMGFSVERIKKFQWVGPYYKHSFSLIAKKAEKIKIHHINDAKTFLIGVVRQDMGHQLLLKKGFAPDNLDLASDIESLFNKINYNRFKLICYTDHAFLNYIGKHHPKKLGQFEPVFQVSNMRSGFGFSKKIPASLVQQFQKTLDELLNTAVVDEILKKYGLN